MSGQAHKPRSSRRTSVSGPGLAAAVIVGAFLLAALPLILTGYDYGRGAMDQNRYHLEVIGRFAEQWPAFDLRDYESATTPGYHIALATVGRLLGTDVLVLRLAGAVFTLGLLGTIAWYAARRVGAAAAVAICAPLVTSLYVFGSGVWLLPDNAAWWGVLAILLLALRPRLDGSFFAAGGLLLLVLVTVRQAHLWAAAVLWAAAWLGPGAEASPLRPLDPWRRGRRAALAAAATAPAFLAVAWFYRLWGGLVPPLFQATGDQDNPLAVPTTGWNPATPALLLALCGVLGAFFAGFLLPTMRRLAGDRRATWVVALHAAAGLAISLAPHSTFDKAAGRWSGLWNIVEAFDRRGLSFADRSPVIVGLGTLGAAWLGLWFVALRSRDRWLLLAAWIAFAAAQTASAFAWQRYLEPFVLMMLAISVVLVAGRPADTSAEASPPRWAAAGPVALALLLAAVTVAALV